jgi:hypothetical protein
MRYCGSEFIRESFIPDAANVLDVLAPSRMNPTDPTICMRYCGSEFIRERFIPDAANVLDVLAPSRMNPTDPTICTRYCGSEFIRESFIPDVRQCVGCTGSFANEFAPTNRSHNSLSSVLIKF